MTYDIRHKFRTKYQIEAHDDIDDDEQKLQNYSMVDAQAESKGLSTEKTMVADWRR